jgi:hypothetical protein
VEAEILGWILDVRAVGIKMSGEELNGSLSIYYVLVVADSIRVDGALFTLSVSRIAVKVAGGIIRGATKDKVTSNAMG